MWITVGLVKLYLYPSDIIHLWSILQNVHCKKTKDLGENDNRKTLKANENVQHKARGGKLIEAKWQKPTGNGTFEGFSILIKDSKWFM